MSILKNRMAEIKKKGFNLTNDRHDTEHLEAIDFSKIKVGVKQLQDAVLDLGIYYKTNPKLGSKDEVLRAIDRYDLDTMREISNFFIKTSGIYNRLCRYMAYLYTYDWLVTPYINEESANIDKVLKNFHKVLTF